MQNIGIFYDSSTGNTEDAAKQMQLALGKDTTQLFDVTNAKASDIEQFVGLPLDEENQSDLTRQRIKKWVEQLKNEFK
jgi:flavodoxin I